MSQVKKLKLKIDLNDLFGTSVNNQFLRQQIGDRIIEKIVKRTQSGEDLNGRTFKKYSKAYTKSLAFKVHGKSEEVDLTLSGDMLADLNIVDESPSKLVIGFTSETENAKAFNHNTGDTLPKREFFGITEDEKAEIISEFQEDVLNFSQAAASQEEQTKIDLIAKLLGSNG